MLEETISKEFLYKGKIFQVELHKIKTQSGNEGKREIVRHPGSVVILPVDSHDNVYLARQFRKPVEKALLELPAGKLEEGESPEICAKRELQEELNFEAKNWLYLTSVYTSPGFTDEKMYFFVCENLKPAYGEQEDDENIEVEKLNLKELWEKIKKGEIEDGKTILAVSLYKSIKNNL